MATITTGFKEKAKKTFPYMSDKELDDLMWLTVQEETPGNINRSDDDLIAAMAFKVTTKAYKQQIDISLKKQKIQYTSSYPEIISYVKTKIADSLITLIEAIKQFKEYGDNIKSFREYEENIVKDTCKELGIIQKELADILGVSKPSVERWAQSEVPEQAKKQIYLLLENKQLKKDLIELKEALKIIAKHSK